MRSRFSVLAALALVFAGVVLAHFPFLHLPYFWDEAGYYIPAALDFYRYGLLIPRNTLPTGHTPVMVIYLAAAWHIFGFSAVTTRTAMLLIAAAAIISTYLLGRHVAGGKAGFWSALLLALSPLFFAQSSLALPDLSAAFFTVLAVLSLREERWEWFAVAGACAVMSKETAVVMLPVIWAFMLFRRKERRFGVWALLVVPILPLACWAAWYHHRTGFWTGNPQYLQYNLYSSLTPLHVLRSFVARVGEVFVQGFNWVLTAGAIAGIWWAGRLRIRLRGEARAANRVSRAGFKDDFFVLAAALIAAYIVMLSLVGGAVLPRYMLPALPLFIILAVRFITNLPGRAAAGVGVMAAACFVGAWFINPPYPFPYEDNLAYTDFVCLHARAAHYLESLPGRPVILTAWPATDELRQPDLGYADRPLRVAAVNGFTAADLAHLPQFDILYLYSRKWQPKHNLLAWRLFPGGFLRRFYDDQPPVPASRLAIRYELKLMKTYQRRRQWVRIYQSCDRRAEHLNLAGAGSCARRP